MAAGGGRRTRDELLPGLGGRAAAAGTGCPGQRRLDYLDASIAQHPIVGTFLFYFMLTNLVLGLFNLLPIPPLDGGRIAVGLLPLDLARRWAQLERDGHRRW